MNRCPVSLVLVMALNLTACASPATPPPAPAPAPAEPDRFLARQVTASDHCGLVAPGLVDIADEATLKRFLSLPAQTLTLPDHPDFARQHFLVVALGQQPSAGYGVTLASSALHDQVLRLGAKVRRPAADQMTAQVVTTPCMVLAIRASDWQRIEVQGDGMPTLTRVR